MTRTRRVSFEIILAMLHPPPLRTLASCLLLSIAYVSASFNVVYTHSLHPPYPSGVNEKEFWEYGGDTVLNTFKHIRLTPDAESKKGYIWTTEPLPTSTWSVEFSFRIHGKGEHVYGDGMAFWYTTEPHVDGPVFGSKDFFNGIGVFFDTFPNSGHAHSFPYVSAMIGDGKKSYDHDGDNERTMAGNGCEADIRGTSESDPVKVRVTYFKNKVFQVEIKDDQRGGSSESEGTQFRTCFVLSNVELPPNGYIGFSAATGGVADNHDLLSVRTQDHLKDETYHGTEKPVSSSEHKEDLKAGSGFSWHGMFYGLLKVVFLGGVCGAAFYAFRVYRRKNDMKRF